jgi:hypothetical protein
MKSTIKLKNIADNITIDEDNLIKLSSASKLDNISSWSLNAWTTCPGKVDQDGVISDVCMSCYALTDTNWSRYGFSNTIALREYNKKAWRHPDFERQFIKAVDNMRYIRLFDSGDFYVPELAHKFYRIAQATPWVKYWIPTRVYKIKKFHKVLSILSSLPNVILRYSSDSIMGDFEPGLHGSTIIPPNSDTPNGVFLCHASKNSTKCDGCRACWDKNIPVIGYVGHGKLIKKQYKQFKIEQI